MSKQVYTVATAHLDTIWSWDLETTIKEYIYHTITDNIKWFKKYPDYRFSFEGAYRYELMEEYYPELFESVKQYVKEGRWNLCGSGYENGDVNVPSPEALLRNFLYGNRYFQKTFGKTSADIFLPDCFGFGWALPSIARHAGLKGFTTQKLAWGSAYGIPFDLGKWVGVDGQYIYAGLNMHDYTYNLRQIRDWHLIRNKLRDNDRFGLYMTAVYYGTGDRGGAPKKRSLQVLEKEMRENRDAEIQVLSASPDDVFDAMDNLDETVKDKLPVWNNELLMSTHAVGSYVSRAISKRWNRKGEELADLAERSAVCAYLLGREYPHDVLETCWKRIIRHQFHDDLTGTSVQRAYRRVWNDYALSINQLIGEYEAATKYIADRLETSWVTGQAIVVNNPCEYDREDIIEVSGSFEGEQYIARDADGNRYPCQKTADALIFIAPLPPLGYKAFDLCEGTADAADSLTVDKHSIENKFLKVLIDTDGWIAAITDKESGCELLQQPIRLAIYDYEGSKHWPAWEIPADAARHDPHYPRFIRCTITESGPVRASLQLEYAFHQSRFVSTVSLAANGQALAVQNEILWHETAAIAKQEFVLTAANEQATFDLGLGAIRRGNRTEQLYEVPAQKWADISDDCLGISVISDSKYSWDKPDNQTLRLTVLHTPKRNYRIDSMQSMMDLGLNRYGFAVTAHRSGDFVKTNRLAKNFHQKMPAFLCTKHGGALASSVSFGEMNNENVLLRAMKKAEDSDRVVLRFNEIGGKEQKDVSFTFNRTAISAEEILANEKTIGKAVCKDNTLQFDISRYGIKSFGVTFEKEIPAANCQTCLALDGNMSLYTPNGQTGHLPFSLPQELAPAALYVSGVRYTIDSRLPALQANGQTIPLPEGTETVYLLCGSLRDDLSVMIGKKEYPVNSVWQYYAGWDLYDYGETAYIKGGRLGFEFTHTHSPGGDEIAKQAFFWLLEVKADGDTLTLPNNQDLLILAITADTDKQACRLAGELFETVEKRPFDFEMTPAQKAQYKTFKRLRHMNDKGRYFSTRNK